jgi:sulfite exporter TauE/SafE
VTDQQDSGSIGPISYIVLGVIVGGLGVLFLSGDDTVLGAVAVVVGVALVCFGGIAQAVRLGISAAGRRDRERGPGA